MLIWCYLQIDGIDMNHSIDFVIWYDGKLCARVFCCSFFSVMQIPNACDATMGIVIVRFVCVCISFDCHVPLLHFESSRSTSSINHLLKSLHRLSIAPSRRYVQDSSKIFNMSLPVVITEPNPDLLSTSTFRTWAFFASNGGSVGKCMQVGWALCGCVGHVMCFHLGELTWLESQLVH